MGRNRRRPKPELTVFFFDGKNETQMGTLRKFSPSTDFESFQAEVSKIIKKPPHQISVYLVNNDVTVDESTSFLKDDRTMRITDSLDDFGQVWSKKNSCLVVVTEEWERETIGSQENVIECQACEYLKKTGGGSGLSYPHRCTKAEATAEGEEKSSFPVYFVDWESTEKKQIGTASITCDTKFKRFQKEVIQMINRSGNKISIYLVRNEVELIATKFWEDDRTIHINKKFKDFSRLIDQKNSSIVVVPIEYVQPQSGNVKEMSASGSQETLFPCEECDNAKKSGVSVPFHHCVNQQQNQDRPDEKAEATAEGEEKSSFPVYFVDAESTEKQHIGTLSITCDAKFKRFQKEVIQLINRWGNKVSMYLVSNEVELMTTPFWEDDRTIHINKKFKDFIRLIRQKNSSFVVVSNKYVQPQSGNVKETTASGSQETLFPCEECDNAKNSGVTVPFHHCVNDPILPTEIREIEFPCEYCDFAGELGVRPWLHLCPNNPVKTLERQNTV